MTAAACGGYSLRVAVTEEAGEAARGRAALEEARLSAGGAGNVKVGGGAAAVEQIRERAGRAGDPKCATNSRPSHGFTARTLKWGTIVPLTGALKPLGEQTARVMRIATEEWLNSITKIPGPYELDWGCSTRRGIYGRTVSLSIFSLNNNTEVEAAQGMRRLIDVENVFLVRDCYLESNLMNAATRYQNQAGVPGVWCFFSEFPFPALAPWNFSPGTDPLKIAGIHTGYVINKLGRRRLAVLADPSAGRNQLAVIRRVTRHLTGKDIPNRCIQYKKAQEAPNGMRSEISAIQGCYGYPAGPRPDAVVALDTLTGVFGALEAKNQGWRGADNGVQWVCTTCWVEALAELCRNACEKMITDCQALPCIPWADPKKYPAAKVLEDVRLKYMASDPPDILTYGPAAITGGLGLWLGMAGPDLSRVGLRNTLENLHNWDAGIGPILNTSRSDHFGGKSVWLITFTGRAPWFDDLTGDFVPLGAVGVPESLTRRR